MPRAAQAKRNGIRIDKPHFYRQIDRIAKEWRLAADDIAEDQHRLYLRDLQRRTPEARAGGGLPGSLKKVSSSKYKDPIERDLRRIFVPVRDLVALRVMRYDILPSTQGKDEWATGVSSQGTAFQLFAPDATMQDMAAHHKAQRSRTTGRVTKAGSWTRDIGRWKFANKMHVPQRTFRRYLRETKKKAGIARSGWNAGIYSVKGKPVSARARRHGTRYGTGRVIRSATGIRLIAENNVPWIHRFRRLYAGAERTRARDLERQLRRGLDRYLDRVSKRKAA